MPRHFMRIDLYIRLQRFSKSYLKIDFGLDRQESGTQYPIHPQLILPVQEGLSLSEVVLIGQIFHLSLIDCHFEQSAFQFQSGPPYHLHNSDQPAVELQSWTIWLVLYCFDSPQKNRKSPPIMKAI